MFLFQFVAESNLCISDTGIDFFFKAALANAFHSKAFSNHSTIHYRVTFSINTSASHTHKKEEPPPTTIPPKREEWGKAMMVHWSECEWTVSQRLWEIKSRQILNELRDKGWREMKRRRSGSVSVPRDCLTTLTDAVFWPQEGHCSQGLTESWLVTQICTVVSSVSSLYSCQNWDYFDGKQTTLERKYEQQGTVNNC